MSQTPGVMGTRGSHDALRAALAKHAPCKVLDIPAGQGPISQFLHERGWDVTAADIDTGHFKFMDRLPFEKVNLNRSLPFANASFDAVVCANALQRLYNPGGAISEFFRILRPGGHLYINVNNYASIERRLRFLFCGSVNTAINECDVDQTIADPEARVRMLLLYPQLANLLSAAGLRR
jgi:SAM-dependent methyltransferase